MTLKRIKVRLHFALIKWRADHCLLWLGPYANINWIHRTNKKNKRYVLTSHCAVIQLKLICSEQIHLWLCVCDLFQYFFPNNFRLFIFKKHENIYCRKELLIISFNPYKVLVICSDFHIKIVTSKIQYVHFFFFYFKFHRFIPKAYISKYVYDTN